MEVCGSEGALEIDFQAEHLTWHRVRHERHADGSWHPVFGDVLVPKLEPHGPVDILASQSPSFSTTSRIAQRPRPTFSVAASTLRSSCKQSPAPPAPTAR
jgi:hypothetical protein